MKCRYIGKSIKNNPGVETKVPGSNSKFRDLCLFFLCYRRFLPSGSDFISYFLKGKSRNDTPEYGFL